jgi:hypothetical protein
MTVTRLARAALIGASLLALPVGALAAAKTSTHRSATAAAAPAAPTNQVEPEAVAALEKMSAFLRSNKTFQVKMQTQRDEVDAFGQILTFNGDATYKVKAPDGLAIDSSDANHSRQYVYDGKSVTVYDPETGYYGHFDAPPTIRQMLEEAANKYGVHIPLTDLFRWGENGSDAHEFTAAHYVGPAKIDGQAAKQYAFRETGVDWQIWIADGDKPVPLRVVIVSADDPAKPQFEADLSWDLTPQFAADTFTFTPPANAKAIPMATANQ